MYSKLAFIFFLFTNFFLFAQSKFEPGTIHLRDGSQEKGLIEFHYSSTKVLFKKTENDTPQTYTSNQIKYYYFEGFSKKIVSEKIDESLHFLEVLVEGKSNLLFFNNDGDKKRYFLKSEKSGLKELDIIIRHKDRSQNSQFKVKRYIGVLNIEFNDCNSITSELNNLRLTQSDLSKIFIEYNNCIGNISFTSERLKRENIHKLVVEVGLYSSKIKSRGTSIRGRDFENSLNPGFGIHYVYTPTALSSRISLSAGVSYNEIKGEAEYFRNVPVLIGDFRTTKIDVKTINLRLGGIFNFNKSAKKFNPHISLYYINSLLLNSSDAYQRIDVDGDESFLYEDFIVPIQKITSGFALEFGVNHNIHQKDDLVINLGYERIGDFLNYSGASYPSNSITIKLGYSFNL